MTQAQVPTVVADYCRKFVGPDYEHPVVVQVFKPGVGWRTTNYAKRVSVSWVRKLKTEGVTAVAVSPIPQRKRWDRSDRTIDFTVKEILKGVK